jgi:hypothetical protein
MESTAARQAREKVVNPAVTGSSMAGASQQGRAAAEIATAPHAIGYGMPCANCRAYYPADMQACPICKSRERVAPTAVPSLPVSQTTPQADEAKLLAEERERLRELKSQIYASHSQVPATTFRCALDQNHDGNVEPAAICHSCYGAARQQADRLEAALHMETREAAKIVYDAVWADTSDPNKTYLNAAAALLSELRKRAGIIAMRGANQLLPH